MRIIFAENENFTQTRIGGISAYIRAITSINNKPGLDFVCIGNGFDTGVEKGNVAYISIGKANVSNSRFLLKLFFLNIDQYIQSDTIIHLQHPYACLPFLKYRKKVKLLLTLHSRQTESFADKRNPLLGLLYHLITKWLIARYDMIISPNDDLLKYYQNKYNIVRIKTAVLAVPVDSDVFKPADKFLIRQKLHIDTSEKIILYAGRIEKVKNLLLLIDAYKMLQEKSGYVRLWIIGEGEEKQKLRAIVKEAGLEHVEFKDTLDRADLSEMMNAADVFALSSRNESGPLVVKEALACNLPVVATDVGDVRDVMSGLDGCYVSSDDVKEFANFLKKAVMYDGKKNYRERILEYGMEEFGRRMEEIYWKNLRF